VLYRTQSDETAIAEAADALKLRYFRQDGGSPIKRSRLTEWLTEAAKMVCRRVEFRNGEPWPAFEVVAIAAALTQDCRLERTQAPNGSCW